MHIHDHVLDPATSISTGLAATAAVGYSLYRLRSDTPGHQTQTHQTPSHDPSLIGVTAACIFAVQMLNFPLPGGTSGHLLGGVLAGIVLGPWAGILTVTAVLIVQCFLFGDGGATALGANVLNMAVVGSGLGYGIYYVVSRLLHGIQGRLAGAALASWTAAVIGASLCAVELSLGGQYGLTSALAAMGPAHMLIGIGEAAATVAVLAVLSNAGDEYDCSKTRITAARPKRSIVTGLATVLFLAAAVSPFVSQLPDALEAVLSTRAVAGGGAATSWAPLANSGRSETGDSPF
jgi:cobalt/nickel transport system permease protein